MYESPWLEGSLILLPYDYTPEGFDKSDGQLLPVKGSELFKLLGTQFGGDGVTDFALPDLREKEPIKDVKYYIVTNGAPPV
ncbi:MAG TPA: tail fiber protein [Candidatus Cybelea sp.]|jgi:microcystin-dependent protein|nr:tail fiber protein [Candidatus Cybelea sp.]